MSKECAYTLGLQEGGLMEDSGFHIEHVCTVYASDLTAAKKQWAVVTGHLDEYWNEQKQTYWGWDVVEVSSNSGAWPIRVVNDTDDDVVSVLEFVCATGHSLCVTGVVGDDQPTPQINALVAAVLELVALEDSRICVILERYGIEVS